MGRYMVNGEVIDVRGDNPTAGELKHQAGGVGTDWVMANMSTGTVVKLNDDQRIPADADSYSVVPAYEYGG